jgi:dihydrofolate synthase/folylpolyglutamate synthase
VRLRTFLEANRSSCEGFVEAGSSWDSAELRSVVDELEHFGVKLGLQRMEALIEALAPSFRPVPAVVVGGTNGKGSVTAFLAQLLQEHGLRTGHFTSPHLSHLRERFRIDGEPLDDARILALFAEILIHRSRPGLEQLTFFEAITGLALLAFSDCDAAVYEVGLGGRLDATRLCGDRVLVITTVDLDHTKTLGETRAAIAREKVQALPEGGVLVFNDRQPELQIIAAEMAAERGARLILRGRDYDGQGSSGSLSFWSGSSLGYAGYEGLSLGLQGAHQEDNAVAALAAFLAFTADGGSDRRPDGPLAIREASVRRALLGARHAGRLERFSAQVPLLMDGAHNVAGAGSLARALGELPDLQRPCVGLLAFSRGKDIRNIRRALGSTLSEVVMTSVGQRRVLPAAESAAAWGAGVSDIIEDPFEALACAADRAADAGGTVVVAGSLFLLGALRPMLLGYRRGTSEP